MVAALATADIATVSEAALAGTTGCQAITQASKRIAFSVGCGPTNRWWRVRAECRSSSGTIAYGYSRWYRGQANAVARCNSYFVTGGSIQFG
jgi:hypothetical protein